MRGYDGGCKNHCYESKADKKIMHLSGSPLWGSSELVHNLRMTQVMRLLNSTITVSRIKTVLPGLTPMGEIEFRRLWLAPKGIGASIVAVNIRQRPWRRVRGQANRREGELAG